MELRLNTNIAARLALLSVNRNLGDTFGTMQRLSSGRRINSASDDPAGLVISERLKSQIASLDQEIENLNGNIGKYRTVSASVSELRGYLTELRSLAVGAANGAVNGDEAQQAWAIAAGELVETYNQTIQTAQYNGTPTLNGSEGSLAGVSVLIGVDLSSPEAAAASIEQVDAAVSELDRVAVDLGATQRNELESRLASLEVKRENLVAAESTVADTDYAVEISNLMSIMIRSQAALAILGHSLDSELVIDLFGV